MSTQSEERTPFTASSPDSAAQSLIFRLIITGFAILLIILGKSNMPYDSVSCIEDAVLNLFSGITDAIKSSPFLVSILQTISNLIVDCSFVGMIIYWFIRVNNFRYILSVSIYGLVKLILLVILLLKKIFNQIQQIPQTLYTKSTLPSIFGADVFQQDYFYNAQCGLVLIAGLEFAHLGLTLQSKLCFVGSAYIGVVSLILRNDYFMDVFVGLAFAHLIYRLIYKYQISKINPILEKIIPKEVQ